MFCLLGFDNKLGPERVAAMSALPAILFKIIWHGEFDMPVESDFLSTDFFNKDFSHKCLKEQKKLGTDKTSLL